MSISSKWLLECIYIFTRPSTIPTIASWYIADLSKAQGKQELFTHQSPQKLKILCEHALIESAVSSNRIEGVNVDQSRIRTIIFCKDPFEGPE